MHHVSVIFQCCSDTMCHIMKQNGFSHLLNYLDDLVYAGLHSEIYKAFDFIVRFTSRCQPGKFDSFYHTFNLFGHHCPL